MPWRPEYKRNELKRYVADYRHPIQVGSSVVYFFADFKISTDFRGTYLDQHTWPALVCIFNEVRAALNAYIDTLIIN